MEPGVNVFVGANGQGKTNMLEAVAMLALSASPRARRELELVGPIAPASRIEAEVESAGRRMELTIALNVEGDRARRTIEVDGARKRAFDLPGHFRVTLFWPDDLDRKSTRLNSSHLGISYAVFCLKKKRKMHYKI